MRCEDIGVRVSRQEFVDFLNGVQPGQFFVVKGYVNASGEKAEHILRFGVKYGNIKDRDIAFLRAVLAGEKEFTVQVKHNVWIPEELLHADNLCSPSGQHDVWATATITKNVSGVPLKTEITGHMNLMNLMNIDVFGNRKGKGRVPVAMSYELSSRHPLVIAAIGDVDLQGTLLQGLVAPRQTGAEYDNQARSCYSLEKEGQPASWYIRDVLRVHKTISIPGNYDFKASLPINATKDAIESQFLLRGKYREFKLTDGQFDSITIAGQAILCDGLTEEFYLALPEVVKEYAEIV